MFPATPIVTLHGSAGVRHITLAAVTEPNPAASRTWLRRFGIRQMPGAVADLADRDTSQIPYGARQVA